MEKMIEVPEPVYLRLIMAEKELGALHAGGVDNWEWYGESLRDAGLFADDEEEGEDE